VTLLIGIKLEKELQQNLLSCAMGQNIYLFLLIITAQRTIAPSQAATVLAATRPSNVCYQTRIMISFICHVANILVKMDIEFFCLFCVASMQSKYLDNEFFVQLCTLSKRILHSMEQKKR
jgi:hypothetical protein